MPTFIKKPVPVEAVRFTGDNWAEMHAFTGHRLLEGQFDSQTGMPVYADVFNPIGTYLSEYENTSAAAELWVEANQSHLPIAVGEWIMQDTHGFYPCKGDEVAPENYETARGGAVIGVVCPVCKGRGDGCMICESKGGVRALVLEGLAPKEETDG